MVLGVRCMTNPDDGQFTIRGEAYQIRNASTSTASPLRAKT